MIGQRGWRYRSSPFASRTFVIHPAHRLLPVLLCLIKLLVCKGNHLLECEEADFGEKFRERVKMACKLFNEKSGKPFLVEISLGIAEFRPNISTDIQQVISLADQQLYEAKKHRKKSVSRANNEGA